MKQKEWPLDLLETWHKQKVTRKALEIVHVSDSSLASDRDLDFEEDPRCLDYGPLPSPTTFERDYNATSVASPLSLWKSSRSPPK